MSAWRISSSSSDAPWRAEAMPTLRRIDSSSPPASIGSWKASMMRLATDSAAPSASTASCRRTANSSPPRRAISSCGRTHERRRSATATSSSSPTAWPSVSLTVLKSSTSMNRTASSSRRGVERLAHAGDEQRAVGQVGQRVVEGLVAELLLEVLQAGDRLLEAVVLQRHGRVVGERLEQLEVVGGEVAHDAVAVGEHQRADHAVLAGEHREHRLVHAALLQVGGDRRAVGGVGQRHHRACRWRPATAGRRRPRGRPRP